MIITKSDGDKEVLAPACGGSGGCTTEYLIIHDFGFLLPAGMLFAISYTFKVFLISL